MAKQSWHHDEIVTQLGDIIIKKRFQRQETDLAVIIEPTPNTLIEEPLITRSGKKVGTLTVDFSVQAKGEPIDPTNFSLYAEDNDGHALGTQTHIPSHLTRQQFATSLVKDLHTKKLTDPKDELLPPKLLIGKIPKLKE